MEVEQEKLTVNKSDKTWRDFSQLVIGVEQIIRQERKLSKGKMREKITLINSREAFCHYQYVYLPDQGTAIFIGDIHGDSVSVQKILEQERFFQLSEKGEAVYLVFLGDYTNRGKADIKTLDLVLNLKLKHPNYVYLLRGNHEEIDMGQHYGFLGSCIKQYGYDRGQYIFQRVNNFFEHLPSLLITRNGAVAVHGGIPVSPIKSLKDIKDDEDMMEIRWNDPTEEINHIMYNYKRGGNYLFGRTIFDNFMQAIGGKILVRSHEYVASGYKLLFDQRLLSIFSNGGKSEESGYQDFILQPKYAKLDLSKPAERWTMENIVDIKY
ncbi:MAG: metallophosphoesterase family protein [Patescibacteria group bacterium]|jgi:hypothetical protein